jgi:nucleoside-diphosphate-sugar epimerase
MKIVVTGGRGFLGTRLVSRLGSNVTVCDLPDCDLQKYENALRMIDGADIVYHLAAIIGSEKYMHGSDSAELNIMQSNLLIDINVFRACIETKVKKVIYTSSCAVYPMRRQQYLGTIFSEEDSEIVDPDGGYGLAKLIGEKQLMWMHDIKVGIVRFFNVYGVGENNHAVSDLIRKAIAYPEKKFEVFGGQQTRDFVYVDDCVDAMITLGNNVGESPIVVNIGSGQATSIKGLAEKIIKISGKDIVPKYVDIPIRQFSRTGNISRAKKVLNWEPQVSLDEGLKRTYGWLQNYSTNLH